MTSNQQLMTNALMTTFIASDNIISPLGFTSSENFEQLKNKQTGISYLEKSDLSQEPIYAGLIDTNKINSEFTKLKTQKEFTRLEKLIILSIQDALKQNIKIDIQSSKTLIILSTTKGNIDLLENLGAFDKKRLLLSETANVISNYFQNSNKPLVVSNACISGVLAIILAKRLLEENTYENIVVVGVDVLTHFVVSGFQSFKAVSAAIAKPYDKNRDGISLGEACGTIILTNQVEHLIENEHIEVKGGSSSNDANHISGPSRTGDGLLLAIEKTLKESGVSPTEIDLISGHGTATLFNDDMESLAITDAQLANVPMNSLKSYFGHTLGAAGVIESIIGIHSMRNNYLIATYNYSEQGLAKPINIIAEGKQTKVDTCLKTAAGFGGCNAAVLFQKESNSKNQISNSSNKNYITSFCSIQSGKVEINGKLDYSEELTGADGLKSIYKHYQLNYPKFYKMDSLCKLGLIASDLLLKNSQIAEKYKPEDIAIILSNRSSSLEIDTEHQNTISDKNNYFPSPSVFVYTLPNIIVGEIAIRNNIKGENTFFIFDKFDAGFMASYVNSLLDTQKAKCCISGWIEFYENHYQAFLYLVEKESSSLISLHTEENLNHLLK